MKNAVSNNKFFLLLLLAYLLLAGTMIFRLPAFSGPNEVLHYEHVALLRLTGKLPDLQTSTRADERHQPPVYYGLAALLSLPFPQPALDSAFTPNPYFISTIRGNLNPYLNLSPANVPVLYASRFTALLFGLLTVSAMYGMARQSMSVEMSLLITSLVAFQPMFLFLSTTANNDIAVTAVAALLLAYSTHLLLNDNSPRRYLFWGILFGLAMLSKASAIFLITLLPILLCVRWLKNRQIRDVLFSAVWAAVGFLPIWAAWLFINFQRSGDALGLAPSVPIRHLLTLSPFDFGLLLPFANWLFKSFWLDWSPGDVGFGPPWVYWAWLLFYAMAVTGWFRFKAKFRQPSSLILIHLTWSAALIGVFLAVKTLMVRDVGFLVPEGRWLLPTWPSLAWLVGAGWNRWWSPAKQKPANLTVAFASFASILLLFIFLFPTLYPQARRLKQAHAIPENAHPVGKQYGEDIVLNAVRSEPFVLGETTSVDLYFETLATPQDDCAVSVQLLAPQAENWITIAKQTSMPGSGLNPTQAWQAKTIYQDRVWLRPEGELFGPTLARLGVWLHGSDDADAWPMVGEVVVRPALPLLLPDSLSQLSEPVNFGGLFELVGLETAVSPDHLLIHLWWQATADVTQDYTIFIHVLDENGNLIAQSDATPAQGSSPTHIWQNGDIIHDSHQLTLDAAENINILVGAYDSNTQIRLPVTQNGRPLPDNVWRSNLSIPK